MEMLNFFKRWFKPHPGPQVVGDALVQRMLRSLKVTSLDELTCEDTYALMDQFAELVANGEDAACLMPLVQAHLDLCGECYEEYEVLKQILVAANKPHPKF